LQIHHAAKHVPEVLEVRVKARWTGHRLQAELVAVYPELSVVEAQAIATVGAIALSYLAEATVLYRAFSSRFNP